MQKCSELTSSLEVWHYLSRYGLPALKVKKGPDGHHLAEACHDQLKKALPGHGYNKLMVWVDRWLKSLDEKDAKTKVNKSRSLPDSQPRGVKNKGKKPNCVIDLCSDEAAENRVDRELHEDVAVKEPAHIEADESPKSPQCTIRPPTSKTYLNTKKPKVQKAPLIRVRTDLKATVTPLSSSVERATNSKPSTAKRKLSTEQPKKPCDSTTESMESCPKRSKTNEALSLLLRESIEKVSPDTTSSSIANTAEPSPVLGLGHILGLLDCVESYATWQHNLEAIALLVKLRDSLQHSN